MTAPDREADAFRRGAEAMREAAARCAETYKRDASFDDSQVGAIEHNANQANIAACIRSLPLPEPASPWRPIATAPKDGTRFDGWLVCDRFGVSPHRIADVKWSRTLESWAAPWRGMSDCAFPDHCRLTHWMPLPEPPAPEGEEG